MTALLYLQVVVSHHTQEGDDGVQYRQAAERRRHVARALLQHEILQSAFSFLFPPGSTSAVPRIVIVAGHLRENHKYESKQTTAAPASGS